MAVIAIASAAPAEETYVKLLKSSDDREPEGKWNYEFESDDKIYRQESGVVSPLGDEKANVQITGSYKFFSPEGKEISVTYVANELGFQPKTVIV